MIGSIAAILTTFAFLPQVVRVSKNKRYRINCLRDVSYAGYWHCFVACSWASYW